MWHHDNDRTSRRIHIQQLTVFYDEYRIIRRLRMKLTGLLLCMFFGLLVLVPACNPASDENVQTDGDMDGDSDGRDNSPWEAPSYCDDETVMRPSGPIPVTPGADVNANCVKLVDCAIEVYEAAGQEYDRDEFMQQCLDEAEANGGIFDITSYDTCHDIMAAQAAAQPMEEVPTSELPECKEPEPEPIVLSELPDQGCVEACTFLTNRCGAENIAEQLGGAELIGTQLDNIRDAAIYGCYGDCTSYVRTRCIEILGDNCHDAKQDRPESYQEVQDASCDNLGIFLNYEPGTMDR